MFAIPITCVVVATLLDFYHLFKAGQDESKTGRDVSTHLQAEETQPKNKAHGILQLLKRFNIVYLFN